MSLISRTAQYALRSMTLLAMQDERLVVRDLAKRVGAPQPYLSRIIMLLADKGFVDARRGPGGGLRLARSPEDIRLIEIILLFDGSHLFEDCALGLPGCQDGQYKCPVHDEWGKIRERIKQWWQNTTLSDYCSENTLICMHERVGPAVEDVVAITRGNLHW